ncbi:hypothetical protein ACLKA7_001978 [Drosophila subpalustris]
MSSTLLMNSYSPVTLPSYGGMDLITSANLKVPIMSACTCISPCPKGGGGVPDGAGRTEGAAKFPDYIEENGQLYRNLGHRADDKDFIPWKLCVPSGQRRRVLQECHDAPMAGHQGMRKTVSRLSQRYCWPGMFRDAVRYVKCCEVYQKYKCE